MGNGYSHLVEEIKRHHGTFVRPERLPDFLDSYASHLAKFQGIENPSPNSGYVELVKKEFLEDLLGKVQEIYSSGHNGPIFVLTPRADVHARDIAEYVFHRGNVTGGYKIVVREIEVQQASVLNYHDIFDQKEKWE